MTWRDRIVAGVLLGVGLYLWFAYPQVMAAILLALLVFALFSLAVMAMMRVDRRRKYETKTERVLRLVNESEPVTHWWR